LHTYATLSAAPQRTQLCNVVDAAASAARWCSAHHTAAGPAVAACAPLRQWACTPRSNWGLKRAGRRARCASDGAGRRRRLRCAAPYFRKGHVRADWRGPPFHGFLTHERTTTRTTARASGPLRRAPYRFSRIAEPLQLLPAAALRRVLCRHLGPAAHTRFKRAG
jgi:hypothetical protein